MKVLTTALCILFSTTIAGATELAHVWSKSFGDWNWQFGLDVAVDPSGNVITIGTFEGTIHFGGATLVSDGGTDVYVAKFRPDGRHIWSEGFGDSSGWQEPKGITVDPTGNIIVVGRFRGTLDFGGGPLTSAGLLDIFVVKFDPDGNHIWSHRFGDASDYQAAVAVAVDGSNNLWVTGYFEGTVDFGGGSHVSAGARDVFVAKFDANGNHLWSQRFGDSDSQQSQDIAVDNSGNVLVTGSYLGEIDFGGGSFVNIHWEDIFLVKFDSDGNHVWSKSFGLPDKQVPSGVAVNGAGDVILAGNFYFAIDFGGDLLNAMGYTDIFLAKFDSDGEHMWSKSFGNDSNYEYVRGLAMDPDGNAIIAGSLWHTVDFGGGPLTSAGFTDIFAAIFDPDGGHLWSRRFGDFADLQQARCVAIDSSGGVIIAGDFHGTVDFGGWPLENTDGFPTYLDVFIAKFTPIPVGIDEQIATFSPSVDAYPNPFNPTTRITYTVSSPGPASVEIYDIRGRRIRSLVNKSPHIGEHTVTWDGRDSDGALTASGVYIVRLETSGVVRSKKLVLLK